MKLWKDLFGDFDDLRAAIKDSDPITPLPTGNFGYDAKSYEILKRILNKYSVDEKDFRSKFNTLYDSLDKLWDGSLSVGVPMNSAEKTLTAVAIIGLVAIALKLTLLPRRAQKTYEPSPPNRHVARVLILALPVEASRRIDNAQGSQATPDHINRIYRAAQWLWEGTERDAQAIRQQKISAAKLDDVYDCDCFVFQLDDTAPSVPGSPGQRETYFGSLKRYLLSLEKGPRLPLDEIHRLPFRRL